MVLLHSEDLDIGSSCPDFNLISAVDNTQKSLSDFTDSKALLIAFICNHCPYVRAIEDRLIKLAKAFKKEDFQLVGICSNDAKGYPSDSPDELRKRWQEKSYGFEYLVDEDQSVAKKFNAVCTPDLFLYDQDRKLYYHGRLDDNWQSEEKVTSQDMYKAIVDMLNSKEPPKEQKPSMGCSIKWK